MPSSSVVAFFTAAGAPARVQKRSSNGNLIKSTYGNTHIVEYEYNDYGQTTKIKKNGTEKYLWSYNSTGMPFSHTDKENNRVYTYEYDSLGRIVRQFGGTLSTGANRFASQYRYDKSNNITKLTTIADGFRSAVAYTYNKENIPTKTTFDSGATQEYVYDGLNRLNSYELATDTPYTVSYNYHASDRGSYTNGNVSGTYRTTQLRQELLGDRGYVYTYDDVGNITAITEKASGSTSFNAKVSYEYDALGQLTRENNVDLNQTIVYNYDNGGNIDSKEIYAYTTATNPGTPTQTIEYTYDSTWKDKLTNYNGTAITYDNIGNPLTYRDNMSFTWNGRQMATAQVVKTENNLTTTTNISYTYDADGLRTTKQVGSTLHEYEYVGDQLVYEKRGNLKFFYQYNALGELASIKRVNAAGSEYVVYVVTNSRGDVEELRKTDGTLYARYVYDSWGNNIAVYDADGNVVTSDKTSYLAVQNPFRYRGYYYDNETGLYYLQSRYYDPVIGRFISADGQLAGVGDSVQGYNLYAYCFNNPVSASDSEGEWPNWRKLASGVMTAVTGMVAVAAVATASACASPILLATVAVAGVASMVFGASEITESFSGNNPVRDTVFKGNTKAYEATKFVSTTIASLGSGSLAKAACFIAGTTILGAWSKKNIEDISPGDYVFATDPESGETRLKKVVQTFVNETDELVYVYVNGEEIVTTPEHPFYVSNNGWVGAINLRAGDKLVLVNGEFAVVEKVQHEILEHPITVYNFEVEDFHTYYVGNIGILVHNMCDIKQTSPNQMQKQVERGQAPSTVVRVDNPKIQGQLPHIHFRDGTAMNIDGSVHDAMKGVHTLTNSERIWLFDNGWGG